MEREPLLLPDTSRPKEMQVFSSVPEADQQAWLHFLHSSYEKEDLGIAPAYTFDLFENGIAPNTPEGLQILDFLIMRGLGNGPLVPNFQEPYEVRHKKGSYVVDPLVDAFNQSRERVERDRKNGPLALVLPHASLATPYAVARSFLEIIGHENADKLHIVIGPRPAVMQFEHFDKETGEITEIKPVQLGQAIAKVLLTGPNTDSTRHNKELEEWLKNLRVDFWAALDEIMEPRDDGENNVVVFCPAGRVAQQKPMKGNALREYRVDGSFDYLTKYKQLRVMPVGAYDRLLVDSKNPESPVIINPDIHSWKPASDNQAQFVHERAVELSKTPVGSVEMETSGAQNIRMARQRYNRFRGKTAERPYLSE